MWVLLRGGVFEANVLQAIRNDSRTDPDFTQVNSGMSHLCDSTVAGLAMRIDNVLSNKCEYPLSVAPLLNVPDNIRATQAHKGPVGDTPCPEAAKGTFMHVECLLRTMKAMAMDSAVWDFHRGSATLPLPHPH